MMEIKLAITVAMAAFPSLRCKIFVAIIFTKRERINTNIINTSAVKKMGQRCAIVSPHSLNFNHGLSDTVCCNTITL